MGKTIVSFTLSGRSTNSHFSRSKTIGSKKLQVSELVKLNKGKEGTLSLAREVNIAMIFVSLELQLELFDNGNVNQHLIIKLNFSDVKGNAIIALTNLLALTEGDGEICLDPELQATDENLQRMVERGKAIMRSKFGKSIRKAIPQINSFVKTVDNIVQVNASQNV